MNRGAARTIRSGIGGFFALCSCPPADAAGFAPIDVTATAISAFQRDAEGDRFGALEFRGGLVLQSTTPAFGGLSGIDINSDGSTLFGVTDTGSWLSVELVQCDGRLVGLRGARMAPILGADGKPVDGKRFGDAEALRIVQDAGRDVAVVSFEQGVGLRRFAASPDLANAAATPQAQPRPTARLPKNRGVEAVAVAPADRALDGATVLFAERSLDANGNHRGWIVGGPRAGAFSLRRYGPFDITDAAFLADGDLLVLERSFSFSDGVAMRLRLIPEDSLRSGRTADGTLLLEADASYEIDNMEGIAVRRSHKGETLITIVSDNNHSILQRTIMLQFALIRPPAPAPRARPRSSANQ